MRPLSIALAALVVNAAVLPALPAFAAPRTFAVAEDVHTLNEAVFSSRAAIVRMTGRTSKATGSAKIDVNDVKAATGSVVLDVGSFDTGIKLRNEHMQGFLESSKYPTATFSFNTITIPGNKLKPNAEISGTADGTMTFHGVTKRISVPVSLTYLPETDKDYRPGDWIQVQSAFKLKLSDYGINLPTKLLGAKVADELSIEINGMAKGH